MHSWADGSTLLTSDSAIDNRVSKQVFFEDLKLRKERWKTVVLRFNPQGQLDPSFKLNGAIISLSHPPVFKPSVAIQKDGAILLLECKDEKDGQGDAPKRKYGIRRWVGYSTVAQSTATVAASLTPVGEEIQLYGTVLSVQGQKVDIKATAFSLPNGNRKDINPPKSKIVLLSEKTRFYQGNFGPNGQPCAHKNRRISFCYWHFAR